MSTKLFQLFSILALLSAAAFAQGSSGASGNVPRDPRWQTIGVGTLAQRPTKGTANRSVYICNGAGCSNGFEVDYCVSVNGSGNCSWIALGSSSGSTLSWTGNLTNAEWTGSLTNAQWTSVIIN